MPKVNMAKVQSMATKAVTKVLSKKLSKMSLEKQVDFCRMEMGMSSMEHVRKTLLGDAGLCLDIAEKLKAGQMPAEIKAYYWGCKPWRGLWVDTMQCIEEQLDGIIEQEVIKSGGIHITP